MEGKMWLLTLGPGKARQGEFLRDAEKWRRYIEAKAYLSSRNESKLTLSPDPQSASELNVESAVCVNIESYNQALPIPHQFEEVSVVSDE
jgi:hypothetical protein